MPFGGSVTLGHTLPLVILAYRRGFKTSFFANVSYSLIHLITHFGIPPAKSLGSFFSIILIDYILPYCLMSVLFCIQFSYKYRILFWIILVFILKIIMSTISGVLLWKDYIPFTFNIWIYSFIYNCMYLVPECIITFFMGKKLFKLLNL